MRLMAIFMSAVFFMPLAGMAQELIDSYTTELSVNDHFNSSGTRLTQPWQIIRQDRANFHRYGIRDSDDTSDLFFSSFENRAIAEQMLRNGTINDDLAARILQQDTKVRVNIYGYGDRGTALEVFEIPPQ